MNLKNSFNMNGNNSPNNHKNTCSSSGFNNSSTSSQMGEQSPYWDLLSLDDVREYEKDLNQQKEAKLRAQRHLRSCLQGQMREKNLKKHINKMEYKSTKNDLLLDKMKNLENAHQLRVISNF